MEYWEYKIEWIKDLTERALNKLGKEGWELISYEAFYHKETNALTKYRVLLKTRRAR